MPEPIGQSGADLPKLARTSLLVIYGAALTGAALTLPLDHRVRYLRAYGLAVPNLNVPRVAAVVLFGLTVVLAVRYRHLSRRAERTLAWLGAAVSIVLLLTSTPFTSGKAHLQATALNSVVLAALVVYLVSGLSRIRSDAGGAGQGLLTAAITLAFVFLLGEAVFSNVPSSHAVGYTLSAKLWNERYWGPHNPAGYRDLDRRAMKGRPIFVIGDSFIAGAGIANIEDRISDLLHNRLAPAYKVYNLGQLGSDTRDEYRRLLRQSESPDAIVLEYYNNDIEQACREGGITVPGWKPYPDLPTAVRAAVQRSYFLDFLYWRFPHGDLHAFESTLEQCYREPAILAAHLADLERFVTYAHDRRVPLIVVAFPHLLDADRTRTLIEPVVQSLRSQQVPVLDVYPILARLSVEDRIVNRNDAHPSVVLNRRIADTLVALLAGLSMDSVSSGTARIP